MITNIENLNLNRPKSHSINKFVIDTIYEYFSPLFLSWKYSKLTKKLESDFNSARSALVTIQDANCFNQSALIQYIYLLSEKHKDIKDEFRNHKTNTPELEEKVRSLIRFMNQDFHKNVCHNFGLLHSYFGERSDKEPRICIKGNFNTHHRDVIVSVFRDTEVSYQSDSDISENTGFYSVAKNGKYFLSNNLPDLASRGLYKNPRLNLEKIANSSFKKSNELSVHWKSFWKDREDNTDLKSIYKSTLIVPMTLWNNQLSSEFRGKIKITDVGRTIFGFLCIDHVDEDYFIEDDIRVGYVFADLLSQYVFHRSVYTDMSETFDDAMSAINSTVDLTSEKAAIPLIDIINKRGHIDSLLELKESSNNHLFGLDEKLMDYLDKKNT